MCLGVPGQVIEVRPDELGTPMGRVRFGGVTKEVCLAYVPEARVGDYVLVHVGFAIARVDEDEARRTLELVRALGETEGIDPGATGGAAGPSSGDPAGPRASWPR